MTIRTFLISLISFIILLFATSAQARFLQTDPIGYGDGLNWYAYVANDPMNKTDPSGHAKCGTLKGENCNEALNDADRAKANIDKVTNVLDTITGKMKNGKELTKNEQATVDAIGKKYGSDFSSQKGLKKFSRNLKRVSKTIGKRGKGMTLNRGNDKGTTTAYVITKSNIFGEWVPGKKAYFNKRFLNSNDTSYRQRAITHEAAHISKFFGDDYNKGGITNLMRNNPRALWGNADTYACGVFPTSCGY